MNMNIDKSILNFSLLSGMSCWLYWEMLRKKRNNWKEPWKKKNVNFLSKMGDQWPKLILKNKKCMPNTKWQKLNSNWWTPCCQSIEYHEREVLRTFFDFVWTVFPCFLYERSIYDICICEINKFKFFLKMNWYRIIPFPHFLGFCEFWQKKKFWKEKIKIMLVRKHVCQYHYHYNSIITILWM